MSDNVARFFTTPSIADAAKGTVGTSRRRTFAIERGGGSVAMRSGNEGDPDCRGDATAS